MDGPIMRRRSPRSIFHLLATSEGISCPALLLGSHPGLSAAKICMWCSKTEKSQPLILLHLGTALSLLRSSSHEVSQVLQGPHPTSQPLVCSSPRSLPRDPLRPLSHPSKGLLIALHPPLAALFISLWPHDSMLPHFCLLLPSRIQAPLEQSLCLQGSLL